MGLLLSSSRRIQFLIQKRRVFTLSNIQFSTFRAENPDHRILWIFLQYMVDYSIDFTIDRYGLGQVLTRSSRKKMLQKVLQTWFLKTDKRCHWAITLEIIFLVNLEPIVSNIFPTWNYNESLPPDVIFDPIQVSAGEISKCSSSTRILFEMHPVLVSAVQWAL